MKVPVYRVKENFDCSYNEIKNFIGSPISTGWSDNHYSYFCIKNPELNLLTNITYVGLPKKIGPGLCLPSAYKMDMYYDKERKLIKEIILDKVEFPSNLPQEDQIDFR